MATLAASAQPTAPAAPGSDFVQVPGIYRQQIAGLQVTALFDGVAFLPAADLKDVAPDRANAWLQAGHVPRTAQGVQTAVNAYLVRTHGQLLLVDAGTAACFGPSLGQVPGNLRAAGVQPQEVQHVLLTHAHPDHLCGLRTADGQAAYPRATVWLSAADAAYWLDTAARDRAPPPMRALFDMARQAVAPYQAAGRFKTFGPGDALPAGAQALASAGHTPGHTSWLLRGDAGQALLLWGDIVHYHAVQFRRPEASYEHDSDRRQAVASRQRLLAQAADRGWWVAGAHLPFPGLGHVRRAGRGAYDWVPVEFGPVGAAP